jgi:diguanylate cyclase (GGDEF)-like protein/PAS domain S-box-containing protein
MPISAKNADLSRQTLTDAGQPDALLGALLNSTDIALISTDAAGLITGFNRGAQILLGFAAIDVVGLCTPQCFHDPVRLAFLLAADESAALSPHGYVGQMLALAAQPDNPFDDWQFVRADGTVVAVSVSVTPIRGPDDGIAGVLHVARDISQRKYTRQAERETADFIRKIATRVPGVICQFRLNTDGTYGFPYASQQLRQIYRTSPETVERDADTVFRIIHPDDAQQVLDSVRLSATQLSPWRQEYRVRFDDGVVRWLFGNAVPERSGDGSILWHGVVTDITERKLIELAAARNQQFLETLIHALPLMIFSKRVQNDSGGGFVSWNSAAERITGRTAHQMLGKTNCEVFPPVLASQYDEHDRLVIVGGKARRLPVHHVQRPDGSWRTLDVSLLPMRDADGKVEYLVGIAEDITEARQQQAQVQHQQAELSAVSDASPLGLFHADRDGICTYVNRAYEVISGLTLAQVKGHPWQLPLAEDERAGADAAWQSAVQAMARFEQVLRFVHADGHVVIARVVAVPTQVDDICTGFVGTIDDITSRRRVTDELRDSENRLRTITDNLPVLIAYVDREQRLRFANQTMHQWMGLAPEQVLGRLVEEVVGPTVYATRRPWMERALGGERVEFELVIHHAGTSRFVRTIYIPDQGHDGVVQGFYALSTDITAQKETENKLRVMAQSDALTGLPNRYRLDQKLREALARHKRSTDCLAVLYLDIDHFKRINDTFGHATGDAVLVEFGARLLASVRGTDTVARLSGDEFVVVLEGLKAEAEATLVSQKIMAMIERPLQLRHHHLLMSTSIGIAYAQQKDVTAAELLALADQAMYRAKQSGNDGFRDLTA